MNKPSQLKNSNKKWRAILVLLNPLISAGNNGLPICSDLLSTEFSEYILSKTKKKKNLIFIEIPFDKCHNSAKT